jgi:hypothetical protein
MVSYSYLKATMGSTRIARSAGVMQAKAATPNKIRVATENVKASRGFTP